MYTMYNDQDVTTVARYVNQKRMLLYASTIYHVPKIL